MANVRVTMNHGPSTDFLKTAEVRGILREVAAPVAARARATAPVDSGSYRDSIEVVDATTDRAIVRVVAKAPHSHIVEARTGNLARALGSEGG